MSTINSKNVQVGTSGTANQNFTLYQPASPDGTVRLGVGNSGATTLDAVTVTSAGNVGVGTSAPGYKLDVNGTARVAGNVTLGDYQNIGATNNNAGISLTGGSTTNNGGQINLRGGSFGTANAIEFIQGGTEQARIDTGGVFKFNSGYGSAGTAYGCRAWVNFNGTGTVAIRASGNVSSITDNGTGDYTVNFTTAMPDANYSVAANAMANIAPGNNMRGAVLYPNTTYSTTFAAGNVRLLSQDYAGGVGDPLAMTVAIFR